MNVILELAIETLAIEAMLRLMTVRVVNNVVRQTRFRFDSVEIRCYSWGIFHFLVETSKRNQK